jgi:polysaccharide deacetylase family protein (PEP-CTERM system associated)
MAPGDSFMNNCILLTIDVEDWFQVENLKSSISFDSWPSLQMRVERNTLLLLDLLDIAFHGSENQSSADYAPKATFFVLGWVAKQAPQLVREIFARGHEIASHGYSHKLCYQCSGKELEKDLSDSRKILEDIIGERVNGYRAPSFSIGPEILKTIEECGYEYDSSYNSFSWNSRYGRLETAPNGTGTAWKVSNGLYEIPISNLQVANHILPMGGGGFFRLIPAWLFNRGVRSILDRQGTYVFYIHPWEIDPEQPRVKGLPFSYRFRHYVNLNKTASRLANLLAAFGDCRFMTCRSYIDYVFPAKEGR